MDEVITQVRENCECFSDTTIVSDTELRAMILQLLSLLSVTLCWNDSVCDNMLYGDRVEEFDYLPNGDDCFTCKPCANLKKFPLFFYTNDVKLDITSVKISTFTGVQDPVETILTSDQYNVRNGVLVIDGNTLPNNCCTCSCDEYLITVEYKSGYEKIPECMLSLFCSLLKSMTLSFLGCGSIDDCCSMKQPQAYQVLTTKKRGDLSYTWKIDTSNVQYIYHQMLSRATFGMMSQLSLCGKSLDEERLWLVSC